MLVDFPGFNWWIARKAKAAGIPVFYYLPPQLWAWAPWRVQRMRKFVDHILCGLPFEPEWYAERGLDRRIRRPSVFRRGGRAHAQRRSSADMAGRATRPIVGILPGSRHHEIEAQFPAADRIMERLAAKFPHVRFLVACYKERHSKRCREMLEAHGAIAAGRAVSSAARSEIVEVAVVLRDGLGLGQPRDAGPGKAGRRHLSHQSV